MLLMRALLLSSSTTSALRPFSSHLVSHLRPLPPVSRLEDGFRLSCGRASPRTKHITDAIRANSILHTSEETDTTRFIGIGAIHVVVRRLSSALAEMFCPAFSKGFFLQINFRAISRVAAYAAFSLVRFRCTVIMVDVVRENFSALLPRVEECVRRCDFVG